MNFEVYGSRDPPAYNLTKISESKVPIALFAGDQDLLADPLDIEWLRDQIKSNVVYHSVIPSIGHMGFVINKNMTYFRE